MRSTRIYIPYILATSTETMLIDSLSSNKFIIPDFIKYDVFLYLKGLK